MKFFSIFDFDSLRETLSTIRKNKLRTFLTGFAVAWGILMLIILLGAGNGLRNGVNKQFEGNARNAVWVWSNWTSLPYKGFSTNRPINFDHRDLVMLREQLPEIEYLSANIGKSVTLANGDAYTTAQINGSTPDGAYINNLKVNEGNGRFINKMDDDNRRKVIVLTPSQSQILFRGADPLGKYVVADNNIAYQVIGVYDTTDIYDSDPAAYIPLSTAQMLYNHGWGYWNIQMTVKGIKTIEESEAFSDRLRQKLAQFHCFDPEDRTAVGIWNSAENAIQAENIFGMLNIFILIIGMASLMAGLVGVGNIMLITVKERTREIGIRKSLGATSASILWLVIFEAIFITTLAGYIGILLGVGLTELVSAGLAQSAAQSGEMQMFTDPTVDLGTVLWAILFLIVCGVVAGAIPALKATRVSPVEAMRAE